MSVLDFGEQAATQAAALGPHLIDPWTFLDYKTTFTKNGGAWTAPTWVGDHFRRLQAYKVYEDTYRNAAREWLHTTDDAVKQERREYGDAFVIVEQYVNSLLGDDQSIVVPAASVQNPPAAAKQFLETLLEWADTAMFDLKSEENERNTVKLGDGVLVIGEANNVPTVEVWDPGFYFPVLDPQNPGSQFPEKVHLAYEFEEQDGIGRKTNYVRRHTYELVPYQAMDSDGNPQYLPDGSPQPATVSLPWNDAATHTCFYTVAVWKVSDIRDPNRPDDLDWDNATRVEQVPLDLRLDFIPVVHVPGILPSLAEHFGFSVLSPVAQVLDDIIANDTDIQKASSTTGSPALAVSGTSLPVDNEGRVTTWGPGQVFQVGDGTATLLDTSTGLDALLKQKDSMLSRLSVNGRIPESLLGRVKPSEVPSGIALTISFGPHVGVIRRMRRIRRRKYALVFKFVSRLLLREGRISEIFPVEYHFGSFIPSDRMETMNLVTQGIQSKPPVISLATAVRMLVEAGFSIDDAVEEVKRIVQEDFETANQMLDATADPSAVRLRLGLSATPPALPGTPATEA